MVVSTETYILLNYPVCERKEKRNSLRNAFGVSATSVCILLRSHSEKSDTDRDHDAGSKNASSEVWLVVNWHINEK